MFKLVLEKAEEPEIKLPTSTGSWKIGSGQTGVNVNILGVSELKWTGMGEFNSDGHYIYYCRQESLRRNGVAIMVNKRVQVQYLDAISKTTE